MGRFLGLLVLATAVLTGFLLGAIFAGAGLKPLPALERAQAWAEYAVLRGDDEYRTEGRRVYEFNCSSCHGVEPDDITYLARWGFRRYTEVGVFRVVANGQGNADMPSFNGYIDDRSILQTMAFLRGLRNQQISAASPKAPLPDGEYEYVIVPGGVLIYDIGDSFRLVRNVRIPSLRGPRGVAAHAASKRLYVSFHGEQSGRAPGGRVVAIDLQSGVELWRKRIHPGIDSLAVTSDGKKIYIPSGEHLDGESAWVVLDAESGETTGTIPFGRGGHNTQVSSDGSRAYLTGIWYPYIGIVDAATDEVVQEVGPFSAGLRPFALSGDERYAFVNVNDRSGFEVADLQTGRVLHQISVEDWPWEQPGRTLAQSHGVAVTPDEREVWVSDSWNRRMHVFDISALPERPVQGADIPLSGAPKWMRFTRDGKYMHVSTGEIVETGSHDVVARVAPSRYYVQVSWRGGEPTAAYSRYGNGYKGHEPGDLRPAE